MDYGKRSKQSFRLLLSFLFLCPWVAVAAQTDRLNEVRTIAVDCAAGESINNALRLAAPSSLLGGTEWIIEIDGVCEENVVLRGMTNVTLRGTDPAEDGIESVGQENRLFPHSAAVYITDAHEIRVENLRLAGWRPLRVGGSSSVRFANCEVFGEGPIAVSTVGSAVLTFTETTISSPDQWALLAQSSWVTLTRTTVSSGLGGVLAFGAADVSLSDSSVVADWIGIYSSEGSWVAARDSRLESPAFAVYADVTGYVSLQTSEIAGCVISVANASVSLQQSTQTAMPSTGWPRSNIVAEDAMLNLWQGTHLLGPIDLYEFSNAVVQGGSTVVGDLLCNQGSDAFCEDGSDIGHAYGCPSTPGFAATEPATSPGDPRPRLIAIRGELRSLIEHERSD